MQKKNNNKKYDFCKMWVKFSIRKKVILHRFACDTLQLSFQRQCTGTCNPNTIFKKKTKKKTLEQAYNLSFAISFYQKLKMFSEAKLYSINK